MSKPNPAATLAQNMVRCLESRRETGPSEYMLPLQDLIDEARDQAGDATVVQALRRKEFKERVVVANAKDHSAPAALQEDLDAFANSNILLDYLKSRTTPADRQPYLVNDLKKAVAGSGKARDLKKAFDAAIRKRIETGSVTDVAPKKLTQAELAAKLGEDLIKVLDSQRGLGKESYPLSLQSLAKLADADPARDEKLILKAAGTKSFKDRAVVAWNKDIDALAAFAEDIEELASRSELLLYALNAARRKTKHAQSIAGLAGTLYGGHNKRLQDAFKAVVPRQCEQDALPPGVGAILDRNLKFFLLDDLLPSSLRGQFASTSRELETKADRREPVATQGAAESRQRTPESPTQIASPPFAEFARRFEEAFSQLDRRHGGHNFVSLAELRKDLDTFPREEFDRHLRQLRVEQRFTLSGAQSKQGLSEEVRDAGVNEAGHLLTYVSRRK
ncbi:MAG: hypothetical protein KY475_06895 [Planctomycetes bacterium]|nr:hypothetical protein [Planctomycetota bacterium]